MMNRRFSLLSLPALWLALACGGGDSPTTPDNNGGGDTTPPPPAPNIAPTAAFTMSVTTGRAPQVIAFDAGGSSDSDGSITNYAWSFGDGATGSGAQTQHTFETGGEFEITLTVTDDRGGTDQTTGSIFLLSPFGEGPNSVEGTIWFDRNSDGIIDEGEPTTAGALVFIDADNDGEWDAGELIDQTNEEGRYRFVGLPADTPVRVNQLLGLGWTNTTPGLGAAAVAARAVAGEAAGAAAGAADGSADGAGPDAFPFSAPPARIVGGDDASIDDYPFQVALLQGNFQFCGGTIINSRWVLTAAHCVDGDGLSASDVTVLARTDNLRQEGELVGVTAIRLHPDYDSSLDADVALLRLDRDLMIARPFLQTPEQLAYSEPGVIARAIGWGQIDGGGAPDQLQETDLPVISNVDCNQIIGEIYGTITARNICAGATDLGTGVCFGDSGGPLLVRDGADWYQIGISSFLIPRSVCGSQPQAFARVSALIDYIASIAGYEDSGSWLVDWSEGAEAVRNFGNFH